MGPISSDSSSSHPHGHKSPHYHVIVTQAALPAATSLPTASVVALGNTASVVSDNISSVVQSLPTPAPTTVQAVQAAVQKTSLFSKLVSGAIAGVIGTSIIYPLDMVKTRLQNQSKAAGSVQYKGGLDCLRTIVRTEGVKGLYKGLPANLVGIIPEKAIKLAVNDYARERLAQSHYRSQLKALDLKKQNAAVGELESIQAQMDQLKQKGPDADTLSIPMGMLAGSIAGFTQVVATNPMEVSKINMQMLALQGQANKSTLTVVKELGLRGLYRGTPATLLRDVPFSFIFFPTSSYLKQLASERDRRNGGSGKVPFSLVFWSGISAGVVAAAAVTPADVIKTRLQTRRTDGVVYRGISHAASEIYKKEGAKAFFKGAPQRVMIIAPLFGITLLVYEVQQRYFSNRK